MFVGSGGTGAIFFAGCNLRCAICKNEDVSHQTDAWREVDPEELAAFMLSLEARGVENLNLITPSHVVPEILDALETGRFRLRYQPYDWSVNAVL